MPLPLTRRRSLNRVCASYFRLLALPSLLFVAGAVADFCYQHIRDSKRLFPLVGTLEEVTRALSAINFTIDCQIGMMEFLSSNMDALNRYKSFLLKVHLKLLEQPDDDVMDVSA
jgi:hypothetical protein